MTVLLGAVLLGGCSVIPVPLETSERERIAAEAAQKLFAGQEPLTRSVSLYEATARALKYQMEYRVRMMEQAVALGQLDVSRFDMLPKLMINAGYSTRDNDSFGFGFSPNGGIATNPSASQERTRDTASVGFTWNVLDFGLSYFRAQQLADQTLIAEERRRKAMQNLAQDVRLAWWRSEAAQRLLPQIDEYLEEIDLAIEKSRIIENRKLLPPMQTASLRRGLLDLQQQISLRRQELAQSRIELSALLNVPPGTQVQVTPPTRAPAGMLELRSSIDTLETIALRSRPEMAEETYKARVNESDIRRSMLQLFPNLTGDVTRNYDSNRFLVNNTWISIGLSVAFNLVKAFSLPALNRSAEAQRQLDDTRRLAVAMAVMTQTRMAAVRYGLLSHEFGVWDQAARDDEQIVSYLSSSADVGIDTEFELIRAKARYLVSKINRDMTYANLEAALGRIHNSVGLDALPSEVESHETAALARQLQARLEQWEGEHLVTRPGPQQLPLMVGEIQGVPEALVKEFVASMVRILELSKVTIATEADAKLSINAAVVLDRPRDGGRPARLRVALLDPATKEVRFSSELKTTLSEPVDIEQWRTLGEGAAYRVLGPVGRMQTGRALQQKKLSAPWDGPALRLSRVAGIPQSSSRQATVNDAAGSLPLRLTFELAPAGFVPLSKAEVAGVPDAQ
ncbi:MAG: TolC family protein [Betaproteobacteria bacterium]|nr:TolC family protein [Betaproteobacteria bacterium]